jgi:hypothetical protein
MEELKKAMAELRDSTKRLNAITDEANNVVRDVEEFLNKECGVGVCASVVVSTREIEKHGITLFTSLSYCRVNGKFRIAVENGSDDDPETEAKAWAECTREEKLLTLPKLPVLIQEIASIVSASVESAQRVVTTVTASMAAVLPKKGGR